LGGKKKIGGDSVELPSGKDKIGSDPGNTSGSGGLAKSSKGKIGSEAPRENAPAGAGLGKQSGNKIGDNTGTPLAKFCPSCGAKFGSDEEKFCGTCGAKRI
jgi:hypothetical protein